MENKSSASSNGAVGGIFFALMCGITAAVFGSAAPRKELIAPTNLLCGLAGAGGIVYSISRVINKKGTYDEEEHQETAIVERPHSIVPSNFENLLPIQRVLDRDAKRIQYIEGLKQGAYMVQDYLERLNPSEYSEIKQIKVYPEQEFKVLGLPCGRKSLEVRIKR